MYKPYKLRDLIKIKCEKYIKDVKILYETKNPTLPTLIAVLESFAVEPGQKESKLSRCKRKNSICHLFAGHVIISIEKLQKFS